ncbi:MAG: NAD(P)-binding domain-containing protein [Chloroflexota bacterium]
MLQIEVVGAGVVGQALGSALQKHAFPVHFVDVDERKVEQLRQQGQQAFLPSESVTAAAAADVFFLSVPTPTINSSADYNFIVQAARMVGEKLRTRAEYAVVIVKSTVLPGTTEQLIIPALEQASQKKAGADFGVCVCPEYLREKHAAQDAEAPRVTLIGEYDTRSGDVVASIFARFDAPVVRTTLRSAEFQKLIHNLYNAVKISFFNEMRAFTQIAMPEIDAQTAFEVTAISSEGMWNPLYGTRDWGPFGAACLPKDVAAFCTWAENLPAHSELVLAAMHLNERLQNQVRP